MTIISKDNRIVVQEKFTETEICLTILALEEFREGYRDYAKDDPDWYPMQPEHVVKNCTKIIEKLKKTLQ